MLYSKIEKNHLLKNRLFKDLLTKNTQIRIASLSLFFMSFMSFLYLKTAACADVLDATQTRVHVVDRPVRIVTLAPSLGELVADLLGVDLERIVGVSEFTDYPPKLSQRTSIGPYHQFSIERVVSLKPDLVLATSDGNPKDRVLRLREMGIPVVVVDTENFVAIENAILIVSSSLGERPSGEKMVEQLKQGLEKFRKKAITRKLRKVLLQVGSDPIVVAGKKSFLHVSLELLGAKNLYDDSNTRYPRPSLEDIIARNPDMILVTALGADMKPYIDMANKWRQFSQLKAVQEKKVHVLKSDELLRPTLRILEGLSKLERLLDEKS